MRATTGLRRRVELLGALLLAAALCGSATAAEPTTASPTTVRVAASKRYRAGRLHRFTFGGGYRDLWETEIELPLLQLGKEGNGLVPTGRHGGLQTAVLSFKGADGGSYTFRGTDKDPSAVLSPILRDTIVKELVQDQMAAQHPAGPVAATLLTEAAGVLTVRARMVVMPDDPALGEYREEFAGMVGLFFEYPQPKSERHRGFHGATEIIDYKELYRRLEKSNVDEVDVEAFLRARLVDILLGDFDRHRKQWRWAKLPGEPRWQPIPEDRDQAFVRYTGLGPGIGRIYVPILQQYGPKARFLKGLTLHGWEQDRWLLAKLSWAQWEPIVADIQARLDNEIIDLAIASLPVEYAEIDGKRLRRDILGRRDNLKKIARKFYENLAREVDVQTSNASDAVTIERRRGGVLRVEVRELEEDGTAGRLIYRREFHPKETKDVRVYLRGGGDLVKIIGRSRRIRLRLIAAGGAKKHVDDSEGGGTRIYDSSSAVSVLRGLGTRVRSRPYEPPSDNEGFVDVEDVPPRDWLADTTPFPQVGFQPDVGIFLGVAVTHTKFGFRKHPWASKHVISGGYAFGALEPRTRYQGSYRGENSDLLWTLDVHYSGIEVLRFYGFGNDTLNRRADRFFRVRNQQARAMPTLSGTMLKDRIRITGGPYVLFSRTRSGERLIDAVAPYGSGNFGQIGAELNVQLDTRRSFAAPAGSIVFPFNDNPAAGYPTAGVFVDLTGRISPPVWDVGSTYGSVLGSIAAFFGAFDGARATMGVRLGGQTNFGAVPYFDYAAIGGGRFFRGSATNRGFRPRRFSGDSSVYANTDLRIFLAREKIIVPIDIGVHGFADAGRVFLRGETSNTWHASAGGGFWFAPLVRANTVSMSVARSREDTLFYFRFGFHY